MLALLNDYRQGLLNGTRGTITAVDEPARRLEVTTNDGTRVTIPFTYAEAGCLTHGYAMTIHKAESATVAIALVLADATMTRQQLYTAPFSRQPVQRHLPLDGRPANRHRTRRGGGPRADPGAHRDHRPH